MKIRENHEKRMLIYSFQNETERKKLLSICEMKSCMDEEKTFQRAEIPIGWFLCVGTEATSIRNFFFFFFFIS